MPVALVGVYATGDLCEPPAARDGSRLVDEHFENVIEAVVVRCGSEYRDGTVVEETKVNWVGTIAAVGFLVGAFFGAAGILRLIDLRKAAGATALMRALDGGRLLRLKGADVGPTILTRP